MRLLRPDADEERRIWKEKKLKRKEVEKKRNQLTGVKREIKISPKKVKNLKKKILKKLFSMSKRKSSIKHE